MGLLIGNIDNSLIPDSVKTALDETVPMYGVLFEPNNTMGTRTYDAAGLVWQRSNNTPYIGTVSSSADFTESAIPKCVWEMPRLRQRTSS